MMNYNPGYEELYVQYRNLKDRIERVQDAMRTCEAQRKLGEKTVKTYTKEIDEILSKLKGN